MVVVVVMMAIMIMMTTMTTSLTSVVCYARTYRVIVSGEASACTPDTDGRVLMDEWLEATRR